MGAPNRARKRKIFVTLGRADYLKAGMSAANFSDDSSDVNVHDVMPAIWVRRGMLFLNLVVWFDAAWQLAR